MMLNTRLVAEQIKRVLNGLANNQALWTPIDDNTGDVIYQFTDRRRTNGVLLRGDLYKMYASFTSQYNDEFDDTQLTFALVMALDGHEGAFLTFVNDNLDLKRLQVNEFGSESDILTDEMKLNDWWRQSFVAYIKEQKKIAGMIEENCLPEGIDFTDSNTDIANKVYCQFVELLNGRLSQSFLESTVAYQKKRADIDINR